jgi:hypothetical protein
LRSSSTTVTVRRQKSTDDKSFGAFDYREFRPRWQPD